MSDAAANVQSYIERLRKPAGVPPFIQREAAQIMEYMYADLQKKSAEIETYRITLKRIQDQAEIEGAYKQNSAFPYIANLAADVLAETEKDTKQQRMDELGVTDQDIAETMPPEPGH